LINEDNELEGDVGIHILMETARFLAFRHSYYIFFQHGRDQSEEGQVHFPFEEFIAGDYRSYLSVLRKEDVDLFL